MKKRYNKEIEYCVWIYKDNNLHEKWMNFDSKWDYIKFRIKNYKVIVRVIKV